MFKKNPDPMRMEPTPERVYAVCKTVALGNISRNDLKDTLSLGVPGKSNYAEINASIAVATDELHILQPKDGKLSFVAPLEIIKSPDSFRKYISSIVFSNADTTFVMFSKWYISQDERIFKLKTWENKAFAAKQEVPELSKLNENSGLGWRFWAAYLGLGYLHETTLIPNAKIRIQDLLITEFNKEFSYGTAISAIEFVQWLDNRMPELEITSSLPLAISSGLRTLNELGLILLESRRDTQRIKLYNVDGDIINDFSHITVFEEVCQ